MNHSSLEGKLTQHDGYEAIQGKSAWLTKAIVGRRVGTEFHFSRWVGSIIIHIVAVQ